MGGAILDLPDMDRELMGLVAQIPAGRVATCGVLAEALGSSAAARWIGQALLEHRHTPDCVCHRVVRADGQLGSYIAGGPEAKARRLRSEGVAVRGQRVNLGNFQFCRFRSSAPLARLRRLQQTTAAKIRLSRRRQMPERVAGVDVSYPLPGIGVAAYAVVEVSSGKLLGWRTVRGEVRFPYITGFLAFRELPLLLELIEEVRGAGELVEPILVDGSGILHPRRAGVASHLGVAASVATVGVTKTLLCGRVDRKGMAPHQSRLVRLAGRPAGVAVRPTEGSRRPIFVSPGHGVGVRFAERLVHQLLRGHRLPEPLYWADRISRQAASQ